MGIFLALRGTRLRVPLHPSRTKMARVGFAHSDVDLQARAFPAVMKAGVGVLSLRLVPVPFCFRRL